jgi:hypothetical protein
MLTAATAAWADQPPEIIEHTNQPLQQTVYGLRQIPQECTGKGTTHYVCWEVYPTAWQAWNKSRKGINLVIKLWVNNAQPAFTDCDMEVLIDRTISPIKAVHFQPGSHPFEGSTATLKDYELVRILALANNAAFSADAKPRLVMKVTLEMIRAIYAVYDRYKSLDAPGGRLEQLNAKLSDLTQKMRDYNAQFALASNQHCTTEVCLNQSKNW